jgi:TPR repeat protein
MGYFDGIQLVQDQDEAIKWIKSAANQGLPAAEHNLAWRYAHGEGVETDKNQALAWYRKAAEQGFAKSQINLGWMYASGDLDKRNYELAEKWMRKAAEQGSAEAQYQFGYLLTQEFNKSGQQVANFQVAAEWFRKAADQGYAKAQYELAELYHTGKLGDDQRSQCIPWFLKAAANGSVEAQAEVGELPRYYPNSPLLKSVNTIEALRNSAENGNLDAQWQLAKRYQSGDGVPKDAVEASKWMQKAAGNSTPSSRVGDAIYELALMYEKGDGVPQDVSEAHRLFLEAATVYRQPEATFRVGQMYEKGDGVPQDDRKAVEFYSNQYDDYNAPDKYPNGFIQYLGPSDESIEPLLHLWAEGRGFPPEQEKTKPGYREPEAIIQWSGGAMIKTPQAQYYAGEIYYQGKLVPKEVAKAADWFGKAAAQGSREAMNRIGEMWATGINGAPDPTEAAKWYQRAASKGLAEAQYNLGICYAKGAGVPADPVQAWKWLQLAAAQTFPNAAKERDKVQTTMTADQISHARTLADQVKTAGKTGPKP